MDNKGMTKAVRNLGKHLRSNCDKILDRTVPFVIDSALLWFVTEAIQSLLSSDATLFPDQSEGFYEYVMFLSDFFEQTPTLCITLSDAVKGFNSIPGNLDLVYFRSLEFMELRKIPPHMVASLQSVKSKLRKLKCSRCIGSVCEILDPHNVPGNSSFRSKTVDGPASAVIMTIWPDLKEVDLSFNRISCVGPEAVESFELAPSVESLNLSRNRIYSIDDSFCKVLNSLRVLNLNYNQLQNFPPIPQNVKTLLLSHNYISSLSSSTFQALKNVEVLDLSGNMIADENHLDPLEELRVLKTLSLVGNPVSFLDNYRFKVCCKLSRYALNRTFVLDNRKLSVSEVRKGLEVSKNLKFVPFKIEDEPPTDLDSSRVNISTPNASAMKSLTQSYDSTSSSLKSSCRKKPKIREPHVYDPDEDAAANSIAEETKISSSVKSTASSESESEKSEIAVVTKNAIQYLRDKYGEENWLLKQAGEEVGKLLGIPVNTVKSPPQILSQSLPSDPVEELNKSSSTSSFYTTAIEFEESKTFNQQAEPLRPDSVTGVSKIHAEELEPSSNENASDDSVTFYPCDYNTFTDDVDQVLSSLKTSILSAVDNNPLPPFKNPNAFTDPEGRAAEFGYFQAGQKYKLVVLDNYLYELDQLKPDIFAAKWDLKSLETISDEKHNHETDTVEFRIVFDTIKKHLRERNYVMTKSDFIRLDEIISPYLEFRTMQEFSEAFQCLKCNAQFSKGLAEKAVRTDSEGVAKEVPICNNPECRSHLLVLLDSTPLPNNETFETGDGMYLNPEDSITGRGSAPKPIADTALFRVPLACSTPTDMHYFDYASCENGIYDKCMNALQVTNGCVGASNHRKMSLDQANTSSNTKSESDVDTLSAHSSSIEVIGAQCDSGSGSDIAEVPDVYEIPSEDLERKCSKTAVGVQMSDSTSSGSCADSICTTYELTRTEAAYQAHEANSTSPGRFSSSMNSTTSDSCSSTVTLVSQSLRINSLQRMLSATAPVNYDYDTFSTIDHRLQLFCEINVFKGADEKLSALAKVLVISENSQFPAVIIFSNRKMYIYKIVGLEGDKPDNWLQKHTSYALQKIVGINVLIGRHGVGIDLQGKYYALIFRDSNRTENFLACYLEKISGENELPPLVRDFSQTHKAFLSPHNPVVYFGIPHYVECDEEKSQTSAVLVTDVEIIFINELMWMGSTRTGTVNASKVQKIANLRQVESLETSDCYVKLIFGSSAHSFWTLYFETPSEKHTFTSALEPYTSKVPFISLSMPIEP